MIRIGLLSDTHGFFDPRINEHFSECHEIWHAGDIGDYEVIVVLSRIAPVIAVYGNIDGTDIRKRYPGHQRLVREELEIWMTQHLFIRGLRLFLTDSTLIGDFKQRLATHLLKN